MANITVTEGKRRIILFSNTDQHLLQSRLNLALALRSAGYEVILMSPPGERLQRFRELGISHVVVKISRNGINPFNEILSFLEIYLRYRKLRPDIVHHFTPKPIIYGTIAARLAGVKTITNTVTGLGYVFSSNDRYAVFLRPVVLILYRAALSLKNVHVIFQNCDDTKMFIEKGIVRKDSISIIKGSGVDCEVYYPHHNTNKPPVSQVKVLFAGRLLREKGVLDFVKMARRLKVQSPSARFVIAGMMDPGNNGSISKEEYDKWRNENIVELMGYRDDMADLLRDVDIVVFPSSYREGVPRILIEAAASEVPIVAYDVPGSREIVEDGVNGFLVPAGDVESLIQAVKRLLNDWNLRVQLGKAGRQKVINEFSSSKVVAQVFQIYQKAVCDHV